MNYELGANVVVYPGTVIGDGCKIGDNVVLDRTANVGTFTNPRFRALSGTQIYSTDAATAGQLLVNTATPYNDAAEARASSSHRETPSPAWAARTGG